MTRSLAIVAAIATMLATSTVVAAANRGPVFINEVPISARQLQLLEYAYGTIQSGAYWYDPVSGLWGASGGPAQGQIAAWLPLGGPLRADASGGNTNVFMNGRELHTLDVQRLRQVFGVVPPGRYWMNSEGIGGPEGGPATFSIAGTSARGSGGYSGGGGAIDRGAGGTWGSSGDCWYVAVEGGDVMGGSGC